MVPQQLVEDVLGCFRRELGQRRRISEILGEVARPADQVHRAIRSLAKRDWLIADGKSLRLTKEGRREAKRILRAHRLWETYLQHVGMPPESLHDQAHRLEHLHDEETVDYLDDKLGHPLKDPHGSAIPEDFEHLIPGAEVKFSLLRAGHHGVITQVAELEGLERLKPGLRVQAGTRSEDGSLWTMLLPDGKAIELEHHLTDAVTIRLEGDPQPEKVV